MNDFLALTRTLFAFAWVYMCILAAVALGLLLFDRGRRPPRGDDDPPARPAIAPRRAGAATRPSARAEALAHDRTPQEIGGAFSVGKPVHDPQLLHDTRSTAATRSSTGRLK